MWASEAEIRERFLSETVSPAEWEAHMEHLYEQQRYEIEAENAWLYAAENTYYDPREM